MEFRDLVFKGMKYHGRVCPETYEIDLDFLKNERLESKLYHIPTSIKTPNKENLLLPNKLFEI